MTQHVIRLRLPGLLNEQIFVAPNRHVTEVLDHAMKFEFHTTALGYATQYLDMEPERFEVVEVTSVATSR